MIGDSGGLRDCADSSKLSFLRLGEGAGLESPFVVADQAGAFAGRLSPGVGVRRGPLVRWVVISSAAWWASMSQGACPPGTSWSMAPWIWSIDGRARSMERYGSSDP